MLAFAWQKAGVPLGTVIWKPPMDRRPESAPQDRPGRPGRSSAHRVEAAGPKGQPPRSRSMHSSRKYWIDDMLRTPGGGGQQLSATHSQNLEVFYAHVPGLKVVAPSTPADDKGLLAPAIRDGDPVLVLENLALYNTKGRGP
jgi:transketolase-like protein